MKKLFLVLACAAAIGGSFWTLTAPKRRTLLITGCARSGTKYIAAALSAGGMDIGHQRVHSDGMSSWDMASNPKVGRWKKNNLKKYHFDHIFHQVRHPLSVISSVYHTEDRHSWNFIMSYLKEIRIQDPHLVKCAKYWVLWNREAEELAEWTYRVEDLQNQRATFNAKLGKQLDWEKISEVAKNTHTVGRGKRQEFTWDDLKKGLDPALYNEVLTLAQKYGYEVPRD